MTDEVTNGQPSPVADDAAPLKSIDTSDLSRMQAKDAPGKALEQKPEPEPKNDPDLGEQDAPAADSSDKEKRKDRLPRWVKERLERERVVTEQRTRESVMREIEQRTQSQQVHPTQHEGSTSDKTFADFDYDFERYAEYMAEQAVAKGEKKRAEIEQQRSQAEAVQNFKEKIDAFEERVGAGAWDDILHSQFNTDPKYQPLFALFAGDEVGLDIAHALASDIEEADRLLSLTPLARVREFAKLSEKFSGEPEKQAPVIPPKKTTTAPPPPKTVAGSGKSIVDLDDPNISTEQRIAEWKSRRKN